MKVIRNIGTLATCRFEGAQHEIHAIPNAAMARKNGTIDWIGPDSDLPEKYSGIESLDARGDLVVPGLVDCHTHLAFGGWRGEEFERRIRGASYLEIARTGGGIRRTVAQTRDRSEEQLVSRSLIFLDEMSSLGVTTAECKSGYGLTTKDELKLLSAYRTINESQPVRIVPTFLGAHTRPPEYVDDRSGYVDLVCNEMIPAVGERQLARFCDAFVEDSAFTIDEARLIFDSAGAYGLRPRLHVDQLSDGGGAAFAAEIGAASADHLEFAADEGIAAMAAADVVAVSLPLAALYLRQQPLRARKWIDAGVRVAVASDFNPGSSPSYHLPLAMMLAATLQGMTPAEALKGATIIAAQSIGMDQEIGSLEVGKAADFAVIDAPDVNHWLYHFRPNACRMTVIAGTCLHKP
jgi:imidazolonepropionase